MNDKMNAEVGYPTIKLLEDGMYEVKFPVLNGKPGEFLRTTMSPESMEKLIPALINGWNGPAIAKWTVEDDDAAD